MKGLILAGGKGTRLQPVTYVVNKHMVPILNRPMILYPLETLKHLGATDIMIVSGGGHIGGIAEFLGDGSEYGVSLTYRVQKSAGGIAQALGLARDFVDGDSVAVVLGDNIFENAKLPKLSKRAGTDTAFLYFAHTKDPGRFGVPVFKSSGAVAKIEEKPKKPKSHYAVTGLYIYPPNVFNIVSTLKPSARGELEITDVNNWYIKKGRCGHALFKGFWSDAGTRESLKQVIDWAYKA
ncbi:spore coat protein [Candidatus Kaiserbacteria bacterium RIFCSPLOWO2_01_FULL_53_17]|uniref:glucose-1-phosphate thymidylyltransferase n=1 Tax=Candidatus Kaiserbacteria bacterium RIFCSPLOWO2_01_FULL_53_17 TaxID=1798511 RepID=A0A1F6EGB3_9BACT|nr:MAG: spore coat protein [Candidatus Kaiserbacteria bacterium RIFCSPLOWO2_01_FULL_53_17]